MADPDLAVSSKIQMCRALFHKYLRSYYKTSTPNSYMKFRVEVIIYDLFKVLYYDLIYGTGLWLLMFG